LEGEDKTERGERFLAPRHGGEALNGFTFGVGDEI
jgi:hypothetical protein